jgi:hypothetical protein
MRSRRCGITVWALALFGLLACSDGHETARDDAHEAGPGSDASVDPSSEDARANTANVPTIPPEWTRQVGECEISLRGPNLMAGAGDSGEYCVATFEDRDCRYRVQYGVFDDPLEALVRDLGGEDASNPNLVLESVLIARNPGRLGVAQWALAAGTFFAALRLPSISGDAPNISLTATADCDSMEALEVARIVLQTVDLPWPGRGLCTPIRPQKCTPI